VKELIARLSEEYNVEHEKARVKEDDEKIQRVSDKYESALLFCGKATLASDPEEVCSLIDAVFTQGKGVTLSTVHKAKGLEAERAFILESALHQSFMHRAKQHWQKEQEKNILYVAVTRAKHELVYL
jgi:superfamily I DNA/RNA helicase